MRTHTSGRPLNKRRFRFAVSIVMGAAVAIGSGYASVAATPAPARASATRPAPSLPGPSRDLEAGRLIAELGQATDDSGAFDRAKNSGFASRALDRLDAAATAAGDARLFAATRTAFSGSLPAAAYHALSGDSKRYLARIGDRAERVAVFSELVTQIAFNASFDRNDRADALQRATLATIDDADDLSPAIGIERQTLLDTPDGAWRAIAAAALALAHSIDGVIGPRATPTPPPAPAAANAGASGTPLEPAQSAPVHSGVEQ